MHKHEHYPRKKVRPKFLASAFLFLGVLLLFGGLYTVGLWVPLIIGSIYLLATGKSNVLGILPTSAFQVGFFVVAISALIVHMFWGAILALSLYMLAFFLLFSFKWARVLLEYLGILGLFSNA